MHFQYNHTKNIKQEISQTRKTESVSELPMDLQITSGPFEMQQGLLLPPATNHTHGRITHARPVMRLIMQVLYNPGQLKG